ncbi:MAG: glycosyltransferase [Bdellovibrionales bacterium]|nr:glycosyltransferase [Bdellovibrionales bacterium]
MDERELASRMKADWDRRIAHDYRFWMSDGYQSDEVMWQSGERDFNIITRDIESASEKSILEIGCGVGRLLKAAVRRYKTVYGLDISEEALKRAGQLIGSEPNLKLLLGDGYTLSHLGDRSIDVVYSFASITSTPLEIFSRYLLEAHRVLKDDAVLRLQVYLGKEQQVNSEDTLHLRCFDNENFERAILAAGYSIEWIEELKLPFQVSFEEAGIIAKIGSFRKTSAARVNHDEIARLLMPNGEPDQADAITGVEVECWMSLNYAKELAESGDIERAKQTLDFAVVHAKSINLDIQDLLEQIVKLIDAKSSELQRSPASSENASVDVLSGELLYQGNLEIIRQRFPDAYQQLMHGDSEEHGVIECKSTGEGDALLYDGQALDHPSAPKRGASSWVKSQLQSGDYGEAKSLVVYGFAGGYHLEALRDARPQIQLSVVEPSAKTLRYALSRRDLRELLKDIDQLIVGSELSSLRISDEAQVLFRPQTSALFPEQTRELKARFYGTRGLELLSPTVSVLGPIQGGTLPILGYTVHGLAQMNQRVRGIDMSSFSGGFNSVEGLVHDEMRQAVLRGKYTETLSDMVLEVANEKPMDILICMAQAPITGKALQALREKGVITVLWFVEDYLRFHAWKYMAQFYDFVFTIQKDDCLEAIKAAGAGEVHYLPTAADPLIHAPMALSDAERTRWGAPISFVGAGYHNRQQMFASLSGLPFKIWGTEWPDCKPFDRMVQEGGRRLKPDEYVKIFNSTDININLHSSTERDGVDPAGDFINPRTFELAASGAFQLVDKRSLLGELFEPGEEIEVFETRAELIEKIDYYLAHPEKRTPFIEKARARVLREHTYQHRLQKMLSIIYSSRYEQLKRRIGTSPWVKVIERASRFPELKSRCETAFKRGEEANLDGLVSDIVSGQGELSETEQKLLFLFHIRKQMIRMRQEETVKS